MGSSSKKVYSPSDSSAPDDAIVLFNGKDLSKWKAKWGGKESEWQINDDGSVTVVFDGTGGIQTKKIWFRSITFRVEN